MQCSSVLACGVFTWCFVAFVLWRCSCADLLWLDSAALHEDGHDLVRHEHAGASQFQAGTLAHQPTRFDEGLKPVAVSLPHVTTVTRTDCLDVDAIDEPQPG